MDSSVYKRPNKPLTVEVTKRKERPQGVALDLPKPLEVTRYTECHVTPQDEARLMAEVLDCENIEVLEPQGGTGALVDAVLNESPLSVKVIERHGGLSHAISARFSRDGRVSSYNVCFLAQAYLWLRQGRCFKRIITNPPFSVVKLHMQAAISLLADDGILVALVPMTYDHPDAELIMLLPNTTFESAKVRTKIIKIEK